MTGKDRLFNPFPGLRPFAESEEHLFFGRDRQVDAMIDRLAVTRFLAVVGTSGSGKSSLVNCGLRPALHRGLMAGAGPQWVVCSFRPGNHPVRALAQALAALDPDTAAEGAPFSQVDLVDATLRTSRLGLVDAYAESARSKTSNLLVVADQFEELFRYKTLAHSGESEASGCADEGIALVGLLLSAAAQRELPIYVVLTMRSDFLGDCARYTGLPEAINAGQYLVPRMSREERRLAIAGPIGVGGGQIAPVLSTRLVNDVGDDPDQLSILQHALNRTWAAWVNAGETDRSLDLRDYVKVGTMAHALDRHAEEAYGSLADEPSRVLCSKLFKALTDQSTDPRGIRRPTRLDQLTKIVSAPRADVEKVLAVFRRRDRAFLMPPEGEPLRDDTVIDISHESLMRVWSRLRGWAVEEAESATTYRRLADAAEMFRQHKQSELYDPALQVFLDWRIQEQPVAPWAERYRKGFDEAIGYLERSEAARSARRAQEQVERRRRRMRKGLLGLALLAAGSWYGWSRWDTLQEEQKREMEAREAAALDLVVGAYRSQARDSLERAQFKAALTYAADAVAPFDKTAKQPTPEDHELLLRVMQEAPDRILSGHGDQVTALAFSADGQALFSSASNGELWKWSIVAQRAAGSPVVSHRPVWTPPRAGQASKPVGFDELRLAERGSALIGLQSGPALFARWDLEAPERVFSIAEDSQRIGVAATLSADGSLLATVHSEGGDAGSLDFLEVRKSLGGGLLLRQPLSTDQLVTVMAFSGDGRWLALGEHSGRVSLAPVQALQSGRMRATVLQGQGTEVEAVAFSPDGRWVVVADVQGTVQLWDTASARRQDWAAGYVDRGLADRSPSLLCWTPDGNHLAWAGATGTLVVWRLSPGSTGSSPQRARLEDRLVLQAHLGPIASLHCSPRQHRLVTVGRDDGQVRLWEVSSEAGLTASDRTFRFPKGRVPRVALSPDGRWLASVLPEDQDICLWDISDQRLWRGRMKEQASAVMALAFDPQGESIVSGRADGGLAWWSVHSRQAVRENFEAAHLDEVTAVAVSQDRRRIASGDFSGQIIVWNTHSGLPERRIPGRKAGNSVLAVAFDPKDSDRLASAGQDGSVTFWKLPSEDPEDLTLAPAAGAAGNPVRRMVFSPDGRSLAMGWDPGRIEVWKRESDQGWTRTDGFDWSGSTKQIRGLAFTPDGRRLLAARFEGQVSLWELGKSSTRPLQVVDQQQQLTSLAMRGKGDVFATTSVDGRLWFWALGERIRPVPLAGPLNAIRRDGTNAGKESLTQVWASAYSPDGMTLATAGADRSIVLWDGDPANWTRRARSMTRAESP